MKTDFLTSDKYLILDGGVGTMLRAAGLPSSSRTETAAMDFSDGLFSIHKAYVDAGADIILANTFGANDIKLKNSGYTVEQVINTSVDIARRAANGKALVALDVSSLGEMLEPGGLLSFEKAYECYRRVMLVGASAGADLVYIETMTDLYELKAALLAAKENTSLPVVASMSFDAGGRTFTGCPVAAFALVAEGLGANALGINCSLGPDEILPMARELCSWTSLPVFIKPNAGLPDPQTGRYGMDADAFLAAMKEYEALGIKGVGGCCGTTPEFIRALSGYFKDKKLSPRECAKKDAVCSSTLVYEFGADVTIVGERINPTGNKSLRAALSSGDFAAAAELAVSQQQAGAHILDVNVGVAGADEKALIVRAVKEIQSVSSLPLMIDSSDPEVIEAALRVCCGKAVVNSVSAEQARMDAILPLCKKYGAAVIGLTLDEHGIPDTAQKRLELARRILRGAKEAGLPPNDVIIDCLTSTLGAQQELGAVTLETLSLVKNQLSLKTALGVSNISFGLPSRETITSFFLTLALEHGLSLAIVNPSNAAVRASISAYRAIRGLDASCLEYIERFSAAPAAAPANLTVSAKAGLYDAIVSGLREAARESARALLQTVSAQEIIDNYLIPALDEVGARYESGRCFLPQLLQSAAAAQEVSELLSASLKPGETQSQGGTILLATVKGDVHDIGKNIVRAVIKNYGYNVIDLGKDVSPQTVLEQSLAHKAGLVGLSALMTTTLGAMSETTALLKRENPECAVMVGGAVVTEEFARSIGADYYARDAKAGVDIAKAVFSKKA